jgi:divalent metal cation (Fe/Co/Zn/Cd) transporter
VAATFFLFGAYMLYGALLSVPLMLGLTTNYFFGLWQVDPLVSLIVVVFLIREGRELWGEANGREEE